MTKATRFRFWLWLIRIIGVIVPRSRRTDWKQEWVAELHYAEPGRYIIAVKVIDIFGSDTMSLIPVNVF